MLTEQGRVVAVESDGLWVETLKESSCGKCSARHGCGQKLLSNVALKSDMTIVKAFHTDSSYRVDWVVGDQAILGVEENALMAGTFIAYGVPLISMIFGMFVGIYFLPIANAEFSSALGAFLGLVCGGVLVRLIGKSQQQKTYFQAYVLEQATIELTQKTELTLN